MSGGTVLFWFGFSVVSALCIGKSLKRLEQNDGYEIAHGDCPHISNSVRSSLCGRNSGGGLSCSAPTDFVDFDHIHNGAIK